MNALRAALEENLILIGDGGIGTRLSEMGVEPPLQPLLPLEAPARVEALHLDYLKAGARLIETHTFQATGPRLSSLGLSTDVRRLNRRAAQIARHARDMFGEDAYIVGSIGPLGQPVASGDLTGVSADAARTAYAEQVAGLLAGGVDGFLIETMSDLGSVEAAVAAIRAESELPILVSFAFSLEGTTRYGLAPEDAARAVLQLPGGPPTAVGANCGTGPMPLLDAILRMAPILNAAGVPLLAYPNAGQPTRRGDAVHYPATPAYMAGVVPALISAGARIVGGCCGTAPPHIAALSDRLSPPAAPALAAPVVEAFRPAAPAEPEPQAAAGDESGFGQKLRNGQFVVSVELDPPRSPNPSRLLAAARRLKKFHVDAINIADSPMARVRMSALATGALVLRHTGIEPIIHFTTRDRNRMGIASDLLGAHALGLRNILCLTGDPPGLGDYAHATAVYDLQSAELVRVLAAFNHGEDGLGQALGQSTAFTIGVGVNPNAPDLGQEVARLDAKLQGGAHFIMAQPLYAKEQLEALLDAAGPLSVPLLVGIMPLVSHRQAEYLHNEVPGIQIPAAIRQAMERAGTEGLEVGVELALAFLAEVEHLVQGVYLIPSFNRIEPLHALLTELDAVRLRRAAS